jgi:predicted mannosyl-3-phosphoglycerate phosphatase (HAD superfamily)
MMRNSELVQRLDDLSKELAALSRRVEAIKIIVSIDGEDRDRQLDAKPA